MKKAIKAIDSANHVLVLQAENPDADSLASALALEDILSTAGKQVGLYCQVSMPKYLRYLPGWDRVQEELPTDFDLAIIVDASRSLLFERTLSPQNIKRFSQLPVIVIDHHNTVVDLPFDTIDILDENAVSTGQVIARLSEEAGWPINKVAAGMIATSIMADSLGLSSSKVTVDTVRTLADMVENGANLSELEERRRELAKKPLDIFRYKGQLFERVELHLDGRVAVVVIPWEDIQAYSDAYNPSMLIIDEMRLIEGVDIAVAFKIYPDGKITAKLRANSNAQFMHQLAEHFGGGGHPFTAGFKVYDTPYNVLFKEFLQVAHKLLETSHD